jgi:hypothetical protein
MIVSACLLLLFHVYATCGLLFTIHFMAVGYLNGTPLKLGEGKCRVIKDRLLALLKDHPGYMIYTTGHSLGGALATLMAFEAATMPEIPKPVTCISVASPKVGNISFRHAVQASKCDTGGSSAKGHDLFLLSEMNS